MYFIDEFYQSSEDELKELQYYNELKESGYASLVVSNLPSNRTSNFVSQSVSPNSSGRQSPLPFSSAHEEDLALENFNQEVLNFSEDDSSEVAYCRVSPELSITLEDGTHLNLDDSTIAEEVLIQPLIKKEIQTARDFLQCLSWEKFDDYQSIQDEIHEAEDFFKKSFGRKPSQCQLDDEEYNCLIFADTLTSMVETAWNLGVSTTSFISEEEEKEESSTESDNSDVFLPNQKCDPPTRPPMTQPLTVLTSLSTKESSESSNCLGEYKIPPLYDDSESAASQIKIHAHNAMPKKDDAFYNIRYKTLPCIHFQKYRQCPAGNNCHFAHGPEELRQPTQHPKFRTQLCSNYSKFGYCKYGKRCFFKHEFLHAGEATNNLICNNFTPFNNFTPILPAAHKFYSP